jgi:hypothetical protein
MSGIGSGDSGGYYSALNLTSATVVKDAPGRLFTVVVVVAGSGAGAIYDAVSTSGNSAANEMFVVPTTAGPINMGSFPFQSGLVVSPGTGQTLAVAYT